MPAIASDTKAYWRRPTCMSKSHATLPTAVKRSSTITSIGALERLVSRCGKISIEAPAQHGKCPPISQNEATSLSKWERRVSKRYLIPRRHTAAIVVRSLRVEGCPGARFVCCAMDVAAVQQRGAPGQPAVETGGLQERTNHHPLSLGPVAWTGHSVT
jgi:hypothetical protein